MKKYLLFIILFLVIVLPNYSFASEIIFSPTTAEIAQGDLVKVNLYLKTGGEDINAAEGKVLFPSGLLSVYNISFGNSILNFWPESPHVASDGVVSFSGVTPGGYASKAQGLLFSIVFKAIGTGNATLALKDALALLDDGNGTPSKLTIGSGSITITSQKAGESSSSKALGTELDTTKDSAPPETFIPLVGNNADIFGGKSFVVFATTDKQSGIDHYEVQESYSNSFNDKKWVKAESPYMLSDQNLHSFIFVKAIDRAGNARIETLSPLYPQKFYQSIVFWVIIMLVIFFVLFFRNYFRKKLMILSRNPHGTQTR